MKKWLKWHCMILMSLAIVCFPQLCMSADKKLISSLPPDLKDGAAAAIMNAVAGKLDARLEIIYAPFKRRLAMMEAGDIDFLTGLLKNPLREKYIHYIYPPYKSRSDTVFFVPRGKTVLVRRYEDLHHLKIGTVVGSKYFPKFDDDTSLNREVCHSAELNLKKLMAGRIDAAAFPESAGLDLIDRMGLKEHVAAADYRFSEQKNVFIGISKKSWLMNSIEQVEDLVRSMIENEELKRVIVDYYTSRGLPAPVF
jgi:polar amino acid transport system substrate-binding protein